MKFFLLRHWETIGFLIACFGFLYNALLIAFIGWPNYPIALAFSVICSIYAVIMIVQFIRKFTLRRIARLIQSALAAIYLALEYLGGTVNMERSYVVITILFYVVIIFTIARFSIWIYKRDQAKKVETEHD